MLQRTHVVLSLALGILLMLSAATGLVLSGSTLVDHLRAAPGNGQSVAAVAGLVAEQVPGVERIERAPSGELRVAFSNNGASDVVLVDPATGAVIAPYQPSPALSWVRKLHRELFLGDFGRWLSGFSALALLLLVATGSWLLARRLGGWSQLLLPIPAGQGLAHWHTVVSRWALPVLAIVAVSGLYIFANSQGLLGDGEGAEPTYPEASYSAPAAELGSLSALRNIALQDLRELEFPSDPEQANYFLLRTTSGAGLVNASTGQWISYQPHGFAARLYETFYELHTGAHSPLWALILSAASLCVVFLGATGLLAWWRRKRQAATLRGNTPANRADIIILVGSQGGATWGYARQLYEQMRAQGLQVHCASMNQLQPRYPQARQMLLLTSTYGDGQAPDSAREFLPRLQQSQLGSGLQVALLGFGDSRFQSFCGYAREVEQGLQQQGLPALLPLHCIDRNSLDALNQWAEKLGQQLAIRLRFRQEVAHENPQTLQLLSRKVYGENSESPAAILRFAVMPRQSRGWLRSRRSRFAPGDLLAVSPGSGLPARYYSIASGDEDAALEICVRKQAGGLCSTRLHQLQVGECIEGFIQPHADFRPTAGQHPLILVGVGAGLAPLIGFVRKNAKQRALHLYWGGRNAQSDFLYEAELSEYLADHRLTKLGLAFSESAEPMYVQDRLRQDAGELTRLLQQGAQVLVCGSREMAAGVRAVIEPLLLQLGSTIEQLRLQGRYREDVY
ncbi:PepSY domain-containing protein [Pseudomonas sp. XK-1]|uniref:PepSY domain-containing protein n=1 Tax=Pseudomonas sp. XK-1 TaxID=3136019 RepID=UPI00311A0DE9